MTNVLLFAFAVLFSVNIQAISYGTDVSEENYQDWIVHLKIPMYDTSDALCGGALIGGKYIITAAHCVGVINYAASPRSYYWYIDMGADNTISVTNSVDSTNISDTYIRTYSVTKLGSSTDNISTLWTTWVDFVSSLITTANISTSENSEFVSSLNRDLVLLTLSSSIPHKTGALIEPLYDSENEIYNVPYNATLNLYGWGRNEDNESQDILQETTEQYNVPYMNHTGLYVMTDSDDSDDYKWNSQQCADSSGETCYVPIFDYISSSANETTGALALSGDSGTPVLYNGIYVGNLSSVNSYYQKNQITFFDYYLDEIADAIGSLVYPSKIEYEVNSGSTDDFTISIPVQNFTNSSVTLYPSIDSNNNEIIASTVGGDCENKTLESKQGCTINIEVNELNKKISGSVSANVYLNNNDNTIIQIIVDTSTNSNSDTTSVTSSSGTEVNISSGGASDIWTLLFLFFFGLKRLNNSIE